MAKSFGRPWLVLAGAALAGTLVAAGPAQVPATQAEPASAGGPTTLRRLNEAQFKNSIAAIFSPAIKVPGRFEPPLREQGLLAIGDGKAVFSASGLEQNELRAREIAAQVLAADKRKTYLPCTPKSAAAFDRPCAADFLRKYGRLLYRRPLTATELATAVNLSAAATAQTGDAYKGLQAGLARMLGSPHFLFRVERSAPDAAMPGGLRLDDYSLATRIAFLLWNAPPDAELLEAAQSGALRSAAGIDRQVDRMMASPQFEKGVRAFFSDMFAFDQFDGLTKDQQIYPKFNSVVAKSAQEQLLRTISNHLIAEQGDYRDLFTTRKTFMNRPLGSVYRIPLPEEAGLTDWVPYTFGESDNRAGILSLVGFLMLDPTHEGRSSPTIRGKNVRELFLCQPVPLPPANVDFAAVQDTADKVHPTARQRLSLHQENPACAGCHALTDPIGLSMENYDALGSFRTHENGALIDASGTFENRSYKNLLELGHALRESPAAPLCATQRMFEYGVGRRLTASEEGWLEFAAQRFAADNYRFPSLIRRIATSQAFRAVALERPLPGGKVAAADQPKRRIP
jgi:hypothetical protein